MNDHNKLADQYERKLAAAHMADVHKTNKDADIHQKTDGFITEKNAEANPNNIQPFGMMRIAPVFHALDVIHNIYFNDEDYPGKPRNV
ncbi:MAG: hypothetical protein JWQ27_1574 [Ferruginibacter sp.]|nr:hypothetical protein [Ferruginibacter sp.]